MNEAEEVGISRFENDVINGGGDGGGGRNGDDEGGGGGEGDGGGDIRNSMTMIR